jgi:outer membrane autotransporter protein
MVEDASLITGSIINTGTIQGGNAAILVNSGATITGGITNSGFLDGKVNLGASSLYLNGTTGRVSGEINGFTDSKVYVNGTFTSEAPIKVGHFEINSGGLFNMAHDVGILAPVTFINSGTLAIAAGDTVTISGHNFVQTASGTFSPTITNSGVGRLVVTENASLDGDLTIAAANPGTGVLESVTNQGNTPATGAATVLDVLIDDYLYGGTGNADIDALLNALGALSTEEEVSNAVSQLLPLLTGGSQIAAGAALNGINRVIQARIESNRGLSSGEGFLGDKKFWMKPFGSWADQNDRKGVSGYEANIWGLALGSDTILNDRTRLGVSFAYANANVDGNDRLQQADVDVYQLVGYGSYSLDPDTELNFQIGLGKNQNSGRRLIPLLSEVAQSDYSSLTANAGLGIGHTYSLSEKTRLTASARADYTWMKDDGYTETGSSGNLTVNGRSSKELILSVDGKVNHQVNEKINLSANLGVGYDALNERASITAAFAGAPGASFVTYGLDPSPWILRAGLGLTYLANDRTEVTARYDAEMRDDFNNQTASVKVRWTF